MAGHMNGVNASTRGNARSFFQLSLLCFVLATFCGVTGSKLQIISLRDGQESAWLGSRHFCYANSMTPGWKETWTKIQVKVWSTKPLKVVVAEDEDRLQKLEGFSIIGLLQYFIHERSNETTVSISLFQKKTCFKIDPADDTTQYTVEPLRKFDINLFLVFLAGVFLFVFADTLSRSQIFFYSAGVSTGVIASLIIVIFIVARFLPKKSPFYVLIVGGWSFSVYAIQLVFRNLNIILNDHWHIAFGYTVLVGFISFAVCYYHGPLVNKKSISILSWTMQLFGLLLIYLGIQIRHVAFAIILAGFCSKNIEYPASLALTAWRRLRPSLAQKPGPRRLLTEEEYQKQSEEETRYALEELRKYCSSPEFSPWRAVSRLQSPRRFAGFVEGYPHVMPNEVSVHAQEYGFGGSFFEDELYATDEEEENGEEEDLKAIPNGD